MCLTKTVCVAVIIIGMWAATNAAALSEQELRGSCMGSSVAMDGNYAAVGASGGAANHGCVYVFKRAGDGSWSQTAVLTANDGGVNFAFGKSVGISGEWIIVGSPNWGFSNPVSSGHVYFFKRNADETWTQKASLAQTLVTDPPGIPAHGTSVAIEGDYAVAGDPAYGVENRGAITVYLRAGDVWNVFKAASYQPGPIGAGLPIVRGLGYSVDISVLGVTPYIVTGAPESSSDGSHNDGRAFLFKKNGAALSVSEIHCQDATRPYYFGHAVSLDWNDRGQLAAAVGSCLNDDYQGAVYLYDYNNDAGRCDPVAKLTRPALADGTGYYGVSVSLRNDVLAVGAMWVGWEYEYGYNAPVWLYYRNQGGPNQWGLFNQVRSQFYADGPPANEMGFGNTWASGMDKGVALSGNSLLVNAPNRTYLVGGVNTTGAAFVFGSGPGDSVRPQVAGVRISEIADNSPSNGFLVVSAGALKDEFEQNWGVDLDTAPYNYEIGATNLHLNEGCSYRLEQVTRGTVPNPDTTNVLDTTVGFPGGCRAVHSSTAQDDWRYDNYMATPGTRDWDQFVYSARTLPFTEDFSSYDFAANNWTISASPKTNWVVNFPDAFAKFYYSPWRSSSFSQAIETPLLSGKGKGTVSLGFDLQLDTSGANRGYRVDVQTMTAEGSWNTVATYTDALGDTTWNGQSIDLSSYVCNTYFRVRFLVSGANTSYLTDWRLDNISVTATEPVLTPPTITGLTLNPLMLNSLQMTWSAGSNGRLHRVYYGTNLVEGINQPLGTFSESPFIMRPPPQVNGAPSVFFRIQSLP